MLEATAKRRKVQLSLHERRVPVWHKLPVGAKREVTRLLAMLLEQHAAVLVGRDAEEGASDE